jgi:hypothetical protein
MNLGPVGKLLSDPNKWDQERDCSTDKNRLTLPTSDICSKWSVRAAAELYYGVDWRIKMQHFMKIAAKHYPGFGYVRLHKSLSHDGLMYLLEKSEL